MFFEYQLIVGWVWEITLLTTILSLLLNRLTIDINLRGKVLHLLLDRSWLRRILLESLLSTLLVVLPYLTSVHLTLLLHLLRLGGWSLHLPAIQLIEPSSVLRLMCLQSDVGGDDFTYLDAELLNLVRTINLDNGS